MNITEFREKVPSVEPVQEAEQKALPKNVKARVKPEVLERPGMGTFPYLGFVICHSHHSGRWWVLDSNNLLICWASNYIDARDQIDYMLAKVKR